jgi:hypothetical protein
MEMIAMRNRLIHAYFDIDHDIVWITAKDYLPLLIQQLERLLGRVVNWGARPTQANSSILSYHKKTTCFFCILSA